MPEVDFNNLPCPFCGGRYEFVMVVYGPFEIEGNKTQAHASVDWVNCPCGAKYTRENGWGKSAKAVE